MHFRIAGLDPASFRSLYGRSDEELAARTVARYRVDRSPGFPDRVELRDLEPGESALLLNYQHLDVPTPYRSAHAVFVREGAERAATFEDEIPALLRVRLLSLRAFDAYGMMLDADVVDGTAADALIRRLFVNPATAYIHAHAAKRGCFLAEITTLSR